MFRWVERGRPRERCVTFGGQKTQTLTYPLPVRSQFAPERRQSHGVLPYQQARPATLRSQAKFQAHPLWCQGHSSRWPLLAVLWIAKERGKIGKDKNKIQNIQSRDSLQHLDRVSPESIAHTKIVKQTTLVHVRRAKDSQTQSGAHDFTSFEVGELFPNSL